MESTLRDEMPDPVLARMLDHLEDIGDADSVALAAELRGRYSLQAILDGAAGSDGQQLALDQVRAFHLVALDIAEKCQAGALDEETQADPFVQKAIAYELGFRVGNGSVSLAA